MTACPTCTAMPVAIPSRVLEYGAQIADAFDAAQLQPNAIRRARAGTRHGTVDGLPQRRDDVG